MVLLCIFLLLHPVLTFAHSSESQLRTIVDSYVIFTVFVQDHHGGDTEDGGQDPAVGSNTQIGGNAQNGSDGTHYNVVGDQCHQHDDQQNYQSQLLVESNSHAQVGGKAFTTLKF